MNTPKSFWELAKNLPTLLLHRVNLLLTQNKDNDTIIDEGLQDLLGVANEAGIPVVGCKSVEIPNGIIAEFSFVDRTTTLVTGFLPNSECVYVMPSGTTGGIIKIAGVHYVANGLTGKVAFVPPFLPVAGDSVYMNCNKPAGVVIDALNEIELSQWDDPYYEEEEA